MRNTNMAAWPLVWAVAGLALLGAAPCAAGDSQGRYFMMGPGQAPCRDFVSAKEGQEDHLFAAWVSGYLTAVNAVLPDTYSIAGARSGDALMQGLDNYCRQNPDQRFGLATQVMVQALQPDRLRQPPP